MPHAESVRWNPPSGRTLADLEGTSNDLTEARSFFALLAELLRSTCRASSLYLQSFFALLAELLRSTCRASSLYLQSFFALLAETYILDGKNFTFLDALSTAAVIRYSRPFGEGIRKKLVSAKSPSAGLLERRVNDVLSKNEESLHTRLLDIRNRHLAHPVNIYEVHDVNIWISMDDCSEIEATAISPSTSKTVCLDLQEAVRAQSLCSIWLDQMNILIQKECTRLLELACRLTASELLDLPQGPRPLNEDPAAKRKYP